MLDPQSNYPWLPKKNLVGLLPGLELDPRLMPKTPGQAQQQTSGPGEDGPVPSRIGGRPTDTRGGGREGQPPAPAPPPEPPPDVAPPRFSPGQRHVPQPIPIQVPTMHSGFGGRPQPGQSQGAPPPPAAGGHGPPIQVPTMRSTFGGRPRPETGGDGEIGDPIPPDPESGDEDGGGGGPVPPSPSGGSGGGGYSGGPVGGGGAPIGGGGGGASGVSNAPPEPPPPGGVTSTFTPTTYGTPIGPTQGHDFGAPPVPGPMPIPIPPLPGGVGAGAPSGPSYGGGGSGAGKGDEDDEWPDLEDLAMGGIVTKPTMARIGERGPEQVFKIGESPMNYLRSRGRFGRRGMQVNERPMHYLRRGE